MAYHLIIVGYDEIVNNKYIHVIEKAINSGQLVGYSVVDLKGKENAVKSMIKKNIYQPRHQLFLNESPSSTEPDLKAFDSFVQEVQESENVPLKMYIGTEVKSHLRYLKYCVYHNISSLTEKPIFAPMKNGKFYPEGIMSVFNDLLEHCKNPKIHSVMTLGRYHGLYNDNMIKRIREVALKYEAPITSYHFQHDGGVLNLQDEYNWREDHPYKYGYGMMMHGAYHYIDISSQILELNKLILKKPLFMKINAYSAYPSDQFERFPLTVSQKLKDDDSQWARKNEATQYGETDITASFKIIDSVTNKTITLGTLSMEQSTPSIRNWPVIPPTLYNKNGRVSNCYVKTQLSTLYSCQVQCLDDPRNFKDLEHIPGNARMIERGNQALFPDLDYLKIKDFKDIRHSNSNRKVLKNWIYDTEDKSTIDQHVLPMKIIQAMLLSAKNHKEEMITL